MLSSLLISLMYCSEPHAHILSLQGHAVLYFAETRTSPPFGCVVLEPLSYFEFSRELYLSAFHFIRPSASNGSEGAFESIPLGEVPCANLHLTSLAGKKEIPRLQRVSVTLRWAHLSPLMPDSRSPEELQAERHRRKGWWAKAVGDG